MKYILLYLMLLINSLTVLLGQTGDTLTCYNNTELQRIATRIVYANECDTLLSIANLQLAEKDTAILSYQKSILSLNNVVSSKDDVIQLKDNIISEKDLTILELNKSGKKLRRQNVILKLGVGASSALFLGSLVYILVSH